MSSFSWQDFLAQWNQKLLAQSWVQQELPEEVLTCRWLGYPGATEAELLVAEARLGTRLPPSYRAFLAVSNGWRLVSPFIPQLWSTQEIEWFARRRSDALAAWMEGERYQGGPIPISDEDYFVYGEQQDCINVRSEYLLTALEISDQEPDGTALLLLNPQITTIEGEWEAWMWAPWLPGAERYRSFLDLMQEQYRCPPLDAV